MGIFRPNRNAPDRFPDKLFISDNVFKSKRTVRKTSHMGFVQPTPNVPNYSIELGEWFSWALNNEVIIWDTTPYVEKNIYTDDGDLEANRTVTHDGKFLWFDTGDDINSWWKAGSSSTQIYLESAVGGGEIGIGDYDGVDTGVGVSIDIAAQQVLIGDPWDDGSTMIELNDSNNYISDSGNRQFRDYGTGVKTDVNLSKIATNYAAIFATDGTILEVDVTTIGGAPDQNLWLQFLADVGSASANTTTDIFTFTGGTGISTAIAGDTITITNDSPNEVHTGEVTGGTVLTAHPTIISNYVDTPLVAGDFILFWDATDAALKKANFSQFQSLSPNLWATFNADSGNTTTNTTTDTLTVSGGTGISTAIVGDVLTITNTGAGAAITASEGNQKVVNDIQWGHASSGTGSADLTADRYFYQDTFDVQWENSSGRIFRTDGTNDYTLFGDDTTATITPAAPVHIIKNTYSVGNMVSVPASTLLLLQSDWNNDDSNSNINFTYFLGDEGIGGIEWWNNSEQSTRAARFEYDTDNIGFRWYLRGVTASETVAELINDGEWSWNDYGVGNYTLGTATYALGVSASGNVMEIPLGGGALTADNGVSINASVIQLGHAGLGSGAADFTANRYQYFDTFSYNWGGSAYATMLEANGNNGRWGFNSATSSSIMFNFNADAVNPGDDGYLHYFELDHGGSAVKSYGTIISSTTGIANSDQYNLSGLSVDVSATVNTNASTVLRGQETIVGNNLGSIGDMVGAQFVVSNASGTVANDAVGLDVQMFNAGTISGDYKMISLSETNAGTVTGTRFGMWQEGSTILNYYEGTHQWSQYGSGSVTAGAPTYFIVVDASGNVIEEPFGSIGLQNIWYTFVADSGSTFANNTTDALTVTGTGGIVTSITGDTLTIDGSGIGGGGGNNIYNTSDSLTANRILTGAGFTLDYVMTSGANVSLADWQTVRHTAEVSNATYGTTVDLNDDSWEVETTTVSSGNTTTFNVQDNAYSMSKNIVGTSSVGFFGFGGTHTTLATDSSTGYDATTAWDAGTSITHLVEGATVSSTITQLHDTITLKVNGTGYDTNINLTNAGGGADTYINFDTPGLSGASVGYIWTLTNAATGAGEWQTGASSQNLWETITSDSGSTVANTPTDNLTVTGLGGITTSISGDTLTIDGTSVTGIDTNVYLNDGTLSANRNIALSTFGLTIDGLTSSNLYTKWDETANRWITYSLQGSQYLAVKMGNSQAAQIGAWSSSVDSTTSNHLEADADGIGLYRRWSTADYDFIKVHDYGASASQGAVQIHSEESAKAADITLDGPDIVITTEGTGSGTATIHLDGGSLANDITLEVTDGGADTNQIVMTNTATQTTGGWADSAFKTDATSRSVDIHNYNPGDLDKTRVLRYNATGFHLLTGINAGHVIDGTLLEIINYGSAAFNIEHDSASSSPANRILCPNSIDARVSLNGVCTLRYDGVSVRWRIISNTI